MAQSLASSSQLLFITFLLFSFATPRTHASFFGPTPQFVTATGQLCCTTNGNCPGTPVVGVTVSLVCFSFLTSTVVATNITLPDGTFTITGPAPQSLLNTPKCYVSVNLPLPVAICPALSGGNGNLVGILQYPGTINTVPVLGTVLNLVVQFFINLSV